eukprot:gb/GFBE01051073.1/.p1 GENE.gb/GFBE01051073.1/~~gb/GFBE01051073.1/.p1  ORF type:complete len:570 (+),score=186.46 gb/GFBE01051073.1/:1-1710(+)
MPIDQQKLRVVQERNDKVTDDIRITSLRLASMDPRNVANTAQEAKGWAHNVTELKASLDEQKLLASEMSESAKDRNQEEAEAFHEKYRFLVETLKADVKILFDWLKDNVDLPQDFSRSRTWENAGYDLDMDLKGLFAASAGKDLLSVDPLVHLLNYRDALGALLLQSLLFRKAVLDWDLKSERAYADGPMVAMSELAVNIFSKTESLPHNFRPNAFPKVYDPGPFSYVKKQDEKGAPTGTAPAGLTPLQCQLLAVLREIQSMDKGLRTMVFAEKVHISAKSRTSGSGQGQNPAAEELLKELDKWFQRCLELEKDLKSNKGEGKNPLEEEVERLEAQLQQKESNIKKNVSKIHKLEGDVQSLRYESVALAREKAEVIEQTTRIAKERVPVIEKMKALVDKSKEAMDRLLKDSTMLSSTFQRQVQETKRISAEKEDISRELSRVNKQLNVEKQKNSVKEAELQKKETLYLRTMAARRCIQDSFNEQRERIAKVEEAMTKRELDRQELLKVIEAKDCEIKELEEDLRRAQQRIEELVEQRAMCQEEFKAQTGRILDVSNLSVAPTLPDIPDA